MAGGGIYDQLGGGFHRYCVDARWLVPHFEKMLYDNALLARAYLDGFQVSGERLFARVCQRDARLRAARPAPGGGRLRSALDADSEGEEGRFYVWTPDEVRAVLGADARRRDRVLRPRPRAQLRGPLGVPVRAGQRPGRAARVKTRLREAREHRVWPGLDDKRLDGLERADDLRARRRGRRARAAGLHRGRGRVRGVPLARSARRRGRLLRTYNRGRAQLGAYLEDHAFLLEALLTLYGATFDPRWFTAARELADAILRTSPTPSTAASSPPPTTTRPWSRAARSSRTRRSRPGASTAAYGLLRLAALTGEHRLRGGARSACCSSCTRVAPQHPPRSAICSRRSTSTSPPSRRSRSSARTPAPLERVVRGAFRPHLVLAGGPADGVPLLEGREPVDGRAAAYVCERFTCLRPVTAPDDLARLL